ncbi:MAG: class I SAM-dependent methyltransferase [Trueperaceae bacterium]
MSADPATQVPSRVAVVAADPACEAAAGELARRLGLPLLAVDAWRAGEGGPVVLWWDAVGLALRGTAASRARPVRPLPPAAARAGRDPLLRAVGRWTDVLDATAGLGGDAGTLAAAGREVTLVERQPALAAMLAEALRRWRADGVAAAARMRLVAVDARDLLAAAAADVVFLDPMYPGPTGGGRARKAEGPHLLRLLAGDDGDQDELLGLARAAARHRVVVKRPLHAPPLAGRPPNGALPGRTVRYDLYAPEEVYP